MNLQSEHSLVGKEVLVRNNRLTVLEPSGQASSLVFSAEATAGNISSNGHLPAGGATDFRRDQTSWSSVSRVLLVFCPVHTSAAPSLTNGTSFPGRVTIALLTSPSYCCSTPTSGSKWGARLGTYQRPHVATSKHRDSEVGHCYCVAAAVHILSQSTGQTGWDRNVLSVSVAITSWSLCECLFSPEF